MMSLKKMYQELNLDTSHFKGKGQNKRNYNYDSFTKGSKKNSKTTILEEDFVQALNESRSIRQALLLLDLNPGGKNYDRAYYLIEKYNIVHLKQSTQTGNFQSECRLIRRKS